MSHIPSLAGTGPCGHTNTQPTTELLSASVVIAAEPDKPDLRRTPSSGPIPAISSPVRCSLSGGSERRGDTEGNPQMGIDPYLPG